MGNFNKTGEKIMETNIEIQPLTPFREREIFAVTRHVFEKGIEIYPQTNTLTQQRPN